MPAYPTPPWLEQQAAPNPAAAFIQNLHVGAQIGMEKQRLQQDAVQAQMVAQARATEAERRATMEQQQIEIDRAQHEQMAELNQRELAQQEQVVQMRTQEAARRFTAQQRYQQRYQALTGTGVDADTAARTAALENAGELLGPGGMDQIIKPRPSYKFVPGDEEQPASWQAEGQRPVTIPRSALPQSKDDIEPTTREIPGTDLVMISNPQTGHFVVRSKGTKTGELSQKDKTALAAKIPGMISQVDKITDEKLKGAAMQKILALNAELARTAVPAGPAAASPPHDEETPDDEANPTDEEAPATSPTKRFRYNLQTRKIEPIEGD